MNSNKVVTATFKLDPDFERGPLMDYTDPVGTGIITGRHGNSKKNHLQIPVEFFKGKGLFLIRISGKDWTTCQLVRLE